jgi:hypothetical protein
MHTLFTLSLYSSDSLTDLGAIYGVSISKYRGRLMRPTLLTYISLSVIDQSLAGEPGQVGLTRLPTTALNPKFILYPGRSSSFPVPSVCICCSAAQYYIINPDGPWATNHRSTPTWGFLAANRPQFSLLPAPVSHVLPLRGI